MICAELRDRLLDEDCRSALLGMAPMPVDVSKHVARCPDCSREWAEAARDARRLSDTLLVSPSPDLKRRLLGAFRAETRTRSLQIDLYTLSRAFAGGGVGAICAPPAVPAWAGFGAGAMIVLAIVSVKQLRHSWRAPWAVVRGAALRSIESLSSAI